MKKKNHRLIATILIVTCCLFAASAADLSAAGYGDSISAAQANALMNLSSTIFGTNVFTGTQVSLDSQSQGGSFSQTSTSMVYGNLISVQYSNAEKTSGSEKHLGAFKVTATIPDSAFDAYLVKAQDAAVSVRGIFDQRAESIESRKSKLSNLLNAISEYNNYRQVLIGLGYGSSVPALGVPVTLQSVYSEYESLLIEEENSLIHSSNTAQTYAIQTQLRLLLEQNRQEQRNLETQRDNTLALSNAMNMASINEQIQRAIETVAKSNTSSTGESQFSDSLKALYQAIADYDGLCKFYFSMIEDEFARLDREYEVNLAALQKKAFKSAELKIDGNPTDSALAVREDEKKDLMDQRDSAKAQVEALVSDSLKTSIQERYDACIEVLDRLQSQSFYLDTRSDDVKLVVGAYDGENFFWNCSIEGPDFSIYDIHIGYELLTGQKPVIYESGKRNKDEYYKYVNDQASYDSALRDNARLFDLCACYHLDIDLEKGRYAFVLDSVVFISANCEVALDPASYGRSNSNAAWKASPVDLSDYGFSWLRKSSLKSASEAQNASQNLQYSYPLIPYGSGSGSSYSNVQYADISTIPYAYTVGGVGVSSGDIEFGLRGTMGFGFSLDSFDADLDIDLTAALDIVWYTSKFTYLGASPALTYRTNSSEGSTTFHIMLDAGLYIDKVASLGIRFGFGDSIRLAAYTRILLPFIRRANIVPEVGIEYESQPNSVRCYVGAVMVW